MSNKDFNIDQTLDVAQSLGDPHEHLSRDLLHIPQLGVLQPAVLDMEMQFLQIEEISEEKPGVYQRAMGNILAAAQAYLGAHIVYLLRGNSSRVTLHLGVAAPKSGKGIDVFEACKNLEAAIIGHLPGIKVKSVRSNELGEKIDEYSHFGLALGLPTAHEDDSKSDDVDFQGIERLIRAMQSSGQDWQLVLVARPLERTQIQSYIDHAISLSSLAATWSKTTVQSSVNSSKQTSEGSNESETTGTNTSEAKQSGKSRGGSETSNGSNKSTTTSDGNNESHTDTEGKSKSETKGTSKTDSKTSGHSQGINLEAHHKWNQALLEHIEENLLPRLRKGMNKGLFDCMCYLAASDASTYKLLAAEVKSTFQGDIETPTPIDIHPLYKTPTKLSSLLDFPTVGTQLKDDKALVHSLRYCKGNKFISLSSLVSVDELALMASLPRREVPGIIRRKNVDFALSLPQIDSPSALQMGAIIDHGRTLQQSVWLDAQELDKHVFITGVTGAGKTTTCMKLLHESDLPFLVIEPAKTEYRAMLNTGDRDIDCYRLGEDPYHCFRINPFQLVHPEQKILAQVSLIQATLGAVFPLEASMPQLVEMAIIRAYEARGWDIHSNENMRDPNPWRADSTVWPTFSDMIAQLDGIILEQKMGKEFEEKYRGSLVSRLSGLTRGVLGSILDVPYSMDFNQLIERNVIIELEGLPSPEHKALLMGLILVRLGEAMKARHNIAPGHRHLTLIEEAHRLLTRPEPGESENRKAAVETFANLLSEVRKYGEGLMIADQIPNKLVSDVIKNTHIKIVHRLYAEDDRRVVGEAMMLNDEQRGFLPNLQTGEAIIYRGGWHGAVRAKIKQGQRTDGVPPEREFLQQQSVQLLWRQRHALYPQLAAAWPGQDAQAFADFTQRGKRHLNLWLKLAVCSFAGGVQRGDNDALDYLHTLQYQQQELSALQQPAEIPRLLAALMLDSRPRMRSQVKDKPAWSTSDTLDMQALLSDSLQALEQGMLAERMLQALLAVHSHKNLFTKRLAKFESF